MMEEFYQLATQYGIIGAGLILLIAWKRQELWNGVVLFFKSIGNALTASGRLEFVEQRMREISEENKELKMENEKLHAELNELTVRFAVLEEKFNSLRNKPEVEQTVVRSISPKHERSNQKQKRG